MFFPRSLILVLQFAILGSASAISSAPSHQAKNPDLERFIIQETASPKDWSYFFGKSAAWRLSLWKYQSSLGFELKDWHWTWRIGWLRSCAATDDYNLEHCELILKNAETDKAVVVRAELINTLKDRHKGSENLKIIGKLQSMYSNPANTRNGKPLFIQAHIIEAIRQIGGSKSAEIADRLASSTSNGPKTTRKQ